MFTFDPDFVCQGECMNLQQLVAPIVFMVIAAFRIDVVAAQSYPVKPIRIVTSFPGGGTDFTARVVAQALGGTLGQQVIVDNRGPLIAMEAVAKAAPDGYTLLVAGNPHWLLPLMRKMSIDPIQDFSPITLVNWTSMTLVVHPSLSVKSVKELIVLAKVKPGQLNYGTGGVGTTPHLGTELFKSMTGVNAVHVPYKGSSMSITGLLSGQLHMMFQTSSLLEPHVKSGRLRALAVSTAQPSSLYPDLPTVAAAGVPGYEAVSIYGLFSPAGISPPLANRLSQEIVRALNRLDVKDKFVSTGSEVVGNSPAEFAAKIKGEMVRLGKVIKDAGITAD
jgi:tripartite-type tricarboxylate transporter receptor subunit TctC